MKILENPKDVHSSCSLENIEKDLSFVRSPFQFFFVEYSNKGTRSKLHWLSYLSHLMIGLNYVFLKVKNK